jgi:subtilisin-like proprotein convertase family protein
MVTAPSSGQRGFGIVTTDLLGYDGYSAGDCTYDFGGTSSAAPAVAGALGVLLGARPSLTRRQVLHLLATTSKQPPTTLGSDWTPRNAQGVSHSHEYGWGLVDLAALISASPPALGPEQRFTTGRISVNSGLADGLGQGFTRQFTVPSPGLVEYVEVKIWLNHARRGDMAISLTDGQGVTSILAQPHADDHAGYHPTSGWTFGSARHWGQQQSTGSWTLSVADAVRNSKTGSLVAFEIVIYSHQ